MKAAFHTLGCKVNQYETEAMIEQFKVRGFELVSEDEFADVYVINTCSVTNLADRKSRQYIRRMKKMNPAAVVAVTGCYAQIDGPKIFELPEVDIVIGMNEKHLIIEYVERFIKEHAEATSDMLCDSYCHSLPYEELRNYVETGKIVSMESRTRAYIKVQEGCNRFCSYCIIPYARGPVRSRSVEAIVDEAKGLVEAGFKELILTGINTALYGYEPGFDAVAASSSAAGDSASDKLEGIEIVIKRINEIPGDFRIRLSSLEPTVINAEYVKRLFKYEKLCHHVHLSIQSGSDRIIDRMNRHYTREEYLQIVQALKDFDPNYGISTDIIVGFPGESEEEFADSLDMVKRARFCKVHTFQYSKRPGTKACELDGHLPGPVKKERSERLIALSDEMTREFLEANLGTVRRVLFEEDGSGYTDNYIRVYVGAEDAAGYADSFTPDAASLASLDGRFKSVMLDEIYKDGVKGHIVI